ncbi:MAG: AI-2E family transporter [bacterium]|nr:AI-2E family transporter [bacterium]
MLRKVELSHRTIIFTALFALLLWFVFQIRGVLLMIFISIILMSALNPAVDKLQKWKLPRGLAIVLVYIVFWGILAAIVAGVVPPLVDQTRKLILLLPEAIGRIEFFNTNQQILTEQLLGRLGALPENILRVTVGIFGNLLAVLSTSVVTFYLLLERSQLNQYLGFLLGKDSPTKVTRVINEIERRLGGWVRGELILMLTVGSFTYAGLSLLGVDIALPLAIIAGVLEIVPNIGPVVSAVPAVLIALTIHPLTALATVALYFLVQILENNLLVPKVMQKAVGVNPLVSILGLLMGWQVAGVSGAVLAIPLIIVAQTIGLELFSLKRLEKLSD